MTPKQISARKESINKKILFWNTKLKELQEGCPHPSATKVAKSSTGGYDGPNYDSYWYEYKCPDCGLFWTEYQ